MAGTDPSDEEDPAVFWPLFEGTSEDAFGEFGDDLGFVRDSSDARVVVGVVVGNAGRGRARERENESENERDARGGGRDGERERERDPRACARANEGGMWMTDGAMCRVIRRMIG